MAKKALRLEDDVRDVLARSSTIDGVVLQLPEQLDRALYVKTNKALEAIGGRWDRKRKGHVFDGDPRAAIAAASETGQVAHPNPDDFFPTPAEIAEIACAKLGAERHHRVLEPSAGRGDLFAPLISRFGKAWPVRGSSLHLFEKDPKRCAELRAKGAGDVLEQGDFLTMSAIALGLFDRVLMNPPFHRGADAAHVAHALDFLKPGGRLVAIVSGGFNSRNTRVSAALLDRLSSWGATFEDLPEGSFKEAGTSVATKLLVVDRPRERDQSTLTRTGVPAAASIGASSPSGSSRSARTST